MQVFGHKGYRLEDSNTFSSMLCKGDPTCARQKLNNHQRSIKTPRTRNKSLLHSTMNPERNTIFLAISNEYKGILRTDLPQLKKSSERGVMLQDWLNQALSGDCVHVNQNRESLATVKQYGLDKRFLKNQNLSEASILRIYNSLFVYSQGIQNAFNQMLILAKPNNEGNDQLIISFWSSFIRLLQKCTSVQTSFQVVEKGYKAAIHNLTTRINEMKEEELMQYERKEQNEKKMVKQFEDLLRKYEHLKADYEIADSTLQITEAGFNEEVMLRLKFQEKVNAMFISYHQVKEKYTSLQQAALNKDSTISGLSNRLTDLESQLINREFRISQLTKKLKEINDLDQERQNQIKIKNIELSDLSLVVSQGQAEDKTSASSLQQCNALIKSLKLFLNQKQSQINSLQKVIKEQDEQQQKLKSQLSDAREKNDDLYLQCSDLQCKILPLVNTVETVKKQLNDKESTIVDFKQKLSLLQVQMNNEKIKVDTLSVQLQNNQKYLKQKHEISLKNKEILEQLRETKGKYERINDIIANQLKQLEQLRQRQRECFTQQVRRCQQLLSEIQSLKERLRRESQLRTNQKLENARKISTQRQQIILKEKNVLQLTNLLSAQRKEILNKDEAIRKLQHKEHDLSNELLKNMEEQVFLTNRLPFIEKQFKQAQQTVQELRGRLQLANSAIEVLQRVLGGKELALSTKVKEISVSENSLEVLLKQTRFQLYQKEQYVHPMIMEDNHSLLLKLREEKAFMRARSEVSTEAQEVLMQQIDSKNNTIATLERHLEYTKRGLAEANTQLAYKSEQLANKIVQYQLLSEQAERQAHEAKETFLFNESKFSLMQEENQKRSRQQQARNDALDLSLKKIKKELSSLKKDDLSKVQRVAAGIQTVLLTAEMSVQSETFQSQLETYHIQQQIFRQPGENHSLHGKSRKNTPIIAGSQTQSEKDPYQQLLQPRKQIEEYSGVGNESNAISLPVAAEREPRAVKPDRKEFRTALRLTYMRR